jgi:hypothetical protein
MEKEFDLAKGAAKASRIIQSARTYEQLQCAKRYMELYEETAERLTGKYMKKDMTVITTISIAIGIIIATILLTCI